jgi:DNA-binding transcriptional LysR family regulator
MGIIDSAAVLSMELKQLRYFVAVAELEHFGRAAEVLHVVQPALSRQVKQLEDEIGAELFERMPRGVRLTAAGKALLEQGRALLLDADRIILKTRLVGEGKTGYLRIGFADGATYGPAMPSILRQFRAKSPNVVLDLVPANSFAQFDLLDQWSINLGFVYWLPDNPIIKSAQLSTERLLLAVTKSSPLAKRKHVRLRDLAGHPFIWFPRPQSPPYYDLVLSQCHRAALTLNVVQDAINESTMLSLVAAGIGATFITESAKRRKPDEVALVPVEDLDATLSLKAIWRSDDKTPALREFASLLRQFSAKK